MIEKKILMVVSYDPKHLPNQPFFNVVRCFAMQFKELHYSTQTNAYDGLSPSFFTKVIKSFNNLIYKRVQVFQEDNIKHIIIRRLKLPHWMQIIFSDLWVIVNLPGWLKKEKYDWCFYSCPQNSLLAMWLKKKKIANKIIYYDIDFFPDHVDARGPLAKRLLTWREKLAIESADGVISVSKPLESLRKHQGAKKTITVPNGVWLDYFMNARQKEPHPPTLIYIGLLSDAWGIDLLLEAMPLIKKEIPEIKLMVVGAGPYSEKLEQMTAELGLQDIVTFYGKQPYHELGRYMRQADVGVAVYKSRKFVEFASPMKIKDYLAAGLPVITSRIGEAEEIINNSCAGELVECSPESIATAAIKILGNRQLSEEYTSAAIRYAPQLDWRVVLEPAINFILSI